MFQDKGLKPAALTLAFLMLLGLGVSLAGDARRTRSGSGGGNSSGKASASGRATASRSGGGDRAPRATASGTATYGHGRYHGSYRYWHPYGHYMGWYWPYWDYYWYARPVVVVNPGHVPATAMVEIDIRPKKSEIVLDGESIGRARDYNGNWDFLWLEPGEYLLEFNYPGYQTLRTTLQVRPGFRYRIEESLARGEGIDPRSRSREGEKPQILPDEGSEVPVSEPVPESTRELANTGTLQRGLLKMHVQPADAAIYLDGQFLARGGELARLHGALPVAAGTHRIEVVRPGYSPVEIDVEVGPEETELLEVNLEKE